ncbi:MAG: hypothetical protein NTV51_17925, partial [Verrucomicrobia bacterium]|nr:hypothetical protein [Verrucomicrobiota bacterium]
YRLARRWRQDLLTDPGALRAWCRELFERILLEPRYEDRVLARRAFFHLYGLDPAPPPEAVAALASALAREFAHWEKLFPRAG